MRSFFVILLQVLSEAMGTKQTANGFYRYLLPERKCQGGVGILGICIPILQQSMSVLDELRDERAPSHKFQF